MGPLGEELIEELDAGHARVSAGYRDLFRSIVRADRTEVWRDSGARDLAAWLSLRYGLSEWKARRWIGAAHALESLPLIAEALSRGELGLDKAVELTRFATPEAEARLIPWAQGVSAAAIRRRGDRAARVSIQEVREAERARSLSWWYTDDHRFGLQADLPAAQGAVVARALDRLAEGLPEMPGEDDPYLAPARRADALVALCSARVAADPDPDRATVVIHAPIGALEGRGSGEIEGGPVIHPRVVRRLLCDARVQTVLEDGQGQVVGVGRLSREPPAWMLRQLRYRDYGCTFPGCGARRFTQAHHITWWERGGRTDLDNLALVCLFHHRLVHEHGWSLRRDPDGPLGWFRPDGTRYRAGPAPPSGPPDARTALVTAGCRASD